MTPLCTVAKLGPSQVIHRSACVLANVAQKALAEHSVLDFAGVNQLRPLVIRCSVANTNNLNLPLSELFERYLFSLQTTVGGPLWTSKDD